MPLFISHLLLQQITTGFYEEIAFRGLLLEGYFQQENRDWKRRLLYASFSFILFGFAHIINGNWITFIFTGSIGFSFSAIYLKSHNIFIPMILHFIYDVFANLSYYVKYNNSRVFHTLDSMMYTIIGVMFVISVIALLTEKKSNDSFV